VNLHRSTLNGKPIRTKQIPHNTEWHKKRGTFEKPNKNWRNPTKKSYWQKL